MDNSFIAKEIPILIPKKNIDLTKFAVVACDQYNAEPTYWNQLSAFIKDSPSAINLIYPEIYLGKQQEARIANINKTMTEYIKNGIFEEIDGFILTERTLNNGARRKGIILPIDLEAYDFGGTKMPIRPTEDTIVSRLPIRMQIRKEAEIELPHTLILIDDDKKEIIESLYENRHNLELLYDTDLNMGGGHIRGYKLPNRQEISDKIVQLLQSDCQIRKYGHNEGLLMAVGDGNHSLATAKKLFEEIKVGLSKEEISNHPARFFLAEVINIYDEALEFLPIHKYVFNTKIDIISLLKQELNGSGKLRIITQDGEFCLNCPAEAAACIHEVGKIIETLEKAGQLSIEYVHGDENIVEVVNEGGGYGIMMPQFKKSGLFNFVIQHGNLPKKAFSIGEANGKRYYLESKRIK